jgi:hypothetical protein
MNLSKLQGWITACAVAITGLASGQVLAGRAQVVLTEADLSIRRQSSRPTRAFRPRRGHSVVLVVAYDRTG